MDNMHSWTRRLKNKLIFVYVLINTCLTIYVFLLNLVRDLVTGTLLCHSETDNFST